MTAHDFMCKALAFGTLIAYTRPLGGVMKTGQDVMESGLYVTDCCGEEVELSKDATFPRCLRCMGLTRWELVEPVDQKAA